jgi:hypothetical protein
VSSLRGTSVPITPNNLPCNICNKRYSETDVIVKFLKTISAGAIACSGIRSVYRKYAYFDLMMLMMKRSRSSPTTYMALRQERKCSSLLHTIASGHAPQDNQLIHLRRVHLWSNCFTKMVVSEEKTNTLIFLSTMTTMTTHFE